MTVPLFHVKRGTPTTEELAALTAVLADKAQATAAANVRRPRAGPPPWGAPTAAHRHPLPLPGPGAWRQAIAGHPANGGLWTAARSSFRGRLGSPSGGPRAERWGFRAAGDAGGAVAAGGVADGGAGGASGAGGADA